MKTITLYKEQISKEFSVDLLQREYKKYLDSKPKKWFTDNPGNSNSHWHFLFDETERTMFTDYDYHDLKNFEYYAYITYIPFVARMKELNLYYNKDYYNRALEILNK
tara:strand:+ start:82 stop:402 length:321 start_codon:yes stop_codon:yes gene_type:complete